MSKDGHVRKVEYGGDQHNFVGGLNTSSYGLSRSMAAFNKEITT
jgi:hypothetical protein